jgi:predicted amidohydrolase
VWDIDGLRVGMLICFDGSFPEASRVLALLGADLIVLPTNWPSGGRCSCDYVPPMRAHENHVYFMAVNRVGEEGGFSFIGNTRVVDWDGKNLAAAPEPKEAVIYAEIDPAKARQKRVVFVPGEYEVDRIAGRRPELYGPLVQRKLP